MRPIFEIAERLGIPDELIEPYGRYTAKLRLELLDHFPGRRGKLILITAITPTSSGEGKTVTTIGLTQGLVKRGHHAIAALREPSLGPVFGQKGGATGGGKASLAPLDSINLHFNGDFHAITAAHNLLAALIDTHLHFGNVLAIDPKEILWPRAMDINDRALRQIATGLGGRTSGPARETGFVITAASEIMAILALADSRADLRRRLGEIVIGFTYGGQPVRAANLKAVGPMMVLLKDALLPNLVQTSEGAPAIVHCGPFANIAHGTSSVLAQRMGLHLADYVVNETGFAADLGAEKFFDLVMPMCGHEPAVAVVIVTLKALRAQGGAADGPVVRGFPNLQRHLENVQRWGVPAVVALNRFPSDTDEDLERVRAFCASLGVDAALSEGYAKGGDGMVDLADKVVAAATRVSAAKPLYSSADTLEAKIGTIATTVYGAAGVAFKPAARTRLQQFADLGYGKLPVCIAKTQYSFSDDPRLMGAPTGWTLNITDATLSAGAGFVVAIAGSMMLMPGLGKTPQAHNLDLDDAGQVIGMDY
ncbi:MAG TPA: formate--tetrahydrofolate ligase [Vicinamibacterales bacterium]|nr:formate--tetrahydrofolate ligase [Vicinamibacterales bacterium]